MKTGLAVVMGLTLAFTGLAQAAHHEGGKGKQQEMPAQSYERKEQDQLYREERKQEGEMQREDAMQQREMEREENMEMKREENMEMMRDENMKMDEMHRQDREHRPQE